MKKILVIFVCIAAVGIQSSFAEQKMYGKIRDLHIVNYQSGAAYVEFEGAVFNECPVSTDWCAIDFSSVSSIQMYAAVLAAKMANRTIGVTTNGCWSNGKYARCWKVHLED